MKKLFKALSQLLALPLLAFIQVGVSVFLYFNYGVVPFIIEIVISLVVYLCIDKKFNLSNFSTDYGISEYDPPMNVEHIMGTREGFSKRTRIFLILFWFLMNTVIFVTTLNIDGLSRIQFILVLIIPNILLRFVCSMFKKKNSSKMLKK